MATYGDSEKTETELKVEKAENGYVVRCDGKAYVAATDRAMLNPRGSSQRVK
jgi:hypothetical protein